MQEMKMKTKKVKTQKTPVLMGHGHINVSNVNSEKSECITFTYSTKNIPSLEEARKLKKAYDDIAGEEQSGYEILIENAESKEQKISSKYKLKLCESESEARSIKKDLDQYVKKKGGQTTLTEDFTESEKEETES